MTIMKKVKELPEWFTSKATKASAWSFVCRYLSDDFSSVFLSKFSIEQGHCPSQRLDEMMNDSSNVFKNDRTTSVAQYDVDSSAYIIKRYNARNTKHHFTRAVRFSRAQRCWSMSYKFVNIGLNVASPVMMCERRFGPLRLDAYFVSEKLSGKELLTAFPQMSDEEKQSVVEQVCDVFAKMQKVKITHGDMKATNLMWVDGQLYFIDLDAAQQHRSNASFKRANAKDKKRFLKNWKDQPELLAMFSKLP